MSLSDVVFKELFETLNSSLENDIDLNLKTTASPENHWDLCPEDELLERYVDIALTKGRDLMDH